MTKENSQQHSRRRFLKTTAAAGAGFWAAGGVSPRQSRAAIDEISFGCVGIDGKGSSDSQDAANNGKVVAVCDIDGEKLDKFKKKFKGAKQFFDYREMLDKMGDKIDAVTVSTPDHTHAVIAAAAMNMGKHCFCQKPLTRTIWEARQLRNLAVANKVQTQMGNQGTAISNLRKSAALVGQEKVVGDVEEIHVWTNRPVWPQAYGLKVKTQSPPEHVKWDLWLGPAPQAEYSPEIHPFKWRGFWNYGTGALGDMACHTLNMSFMALDLRDPISVEAKADRHDGVCFPKWSEIEFQFPERNGRKACKMVWYDGGRLPNEELTKDLPRDRNGNLHTSGALIVGKKGKFYSPGDYGQLTRYTGTVVDGNFTMIRKLKADFEKSPGHFVEFANAIRTGKAAKSNFVDYAGPLTETILLGNLAVWSGKKVDWNAEKMVAAGSDKSVQDLIRPKFENGYSIKTKS